MTLFYVISFLIGLGFGSFSSVVIHRLHHKQKGIWWGRSKCPKCKHVLNALDLIPLLGFVINKSKCRYCKKPISLKYPILEFVMGAGFLGTTILVGFDQLWLLAYYIFLTFIFVLLSFYDIAYQEIPDEISLPTVVIAGLVGYFGHIHEPKMLLFGFLVPVLFFGILFLGSSGRWLGGGDVRIGGIMGFVLGWPNVIVGLFLAYLIGAVFSMIGLSTEKLTQKSPIPFGPFLFLGTYIAIFWGTDIVEWYLSFM